MRGINRKRVKRESLSNLDGSGLEWMKKIKNKRKGLGTEI